DLPRTSDIALPPFSPRATEARPAAVIWIRLIHVDDAHPTMTPEIHSLATTTHGRVLLRPAAGAPRGLIVGFHGYLENAAIQLTRLQGIRGADWWTLLSLQGLNR